MDRVLIVACGPSVEGCDINVPDSVHVIAVNGAVLWAPVVHTFFSLDPCPYIDALVSRKRPGVRYVLAVPDDYGSRHAKHPYHRAPRDVGVTYLRRVTGVGPFSSAMGLSEDPQAINTGNSAYGALGLAYHMRPQRIALLGLDGAGGHAYSTEPSQNLGHLPPLFASTLPQLRGISVVNGSPDSTVDCFERMAPADAVRWITEDL